MRLMPVVLLLAACAHRRPPPHVDLGDARVLHFELQGGKRVLPLVRRAVEDRAQAGGRFIASFEPGVAAEDVDVRIVVVSTGAEANRQRMSNSDLVEARVVLSATVQTVGGKRYFTEHRFESTGSSGIDAEAAVSAAVHGAVEDLFDALTPVPR